MSALDAERRPARPLVLHGLNRRIVIILDSRALLTGAGLAAAIIVVGAVTLSTGDYRVPLAEVPRTLVGGGNPAQRFIVESVRLPRLVAGLLVGGALGAGGAIFQSLSGNPLGSPDVVGFDTGAATGALIVIVVLHGSTWQASGAAVLGGVGTALLVYLLAIRRGVQGYRLILVGIGIAAMLTSVNSYLITRANLADAQDAAAWLTGSLNGRGWGQVRPAALALAVLAPCAVRLGRELRMLELGEDTARALGVRAEGTRLTAVIVGVAMSAVATAVAGPIAFIALSAPQLARRLTRVPGPNVITAALTGALLLASSDLAAQRVLGSDQLPVGVVTGVVGGLYLAWLLAREWRRGRG